MAKRTTCIGSGLMKSAILSFVAVSVLLCNNECYGQALEFLLEPSDTLVPEGSSVLLQCAGRSVSGISKEGKIAPNIRWRGPDRQDIGIVGDTFRTQLSNGSLYISSIEENRGLTGSYQCLLSLDKVGTIVSKSATVSIGKLPDTNQDTNEIYLFPGQAAYFRCLLSIPPTKIAFTIQWLKDEAPIRLDPSRMIQLPSGSLEIDEVSASDRGTYQCNVTAGSVSRLSSKTNLNIKSTAGSPESFAVPSFISVPTPQTVREGDTVTLDCVANGNPKPSIRWLRNGEDIDMKNLDSRFRIVGTGSLRITSVQEADMADYQCRASNEMDSLDASATLQVQVPPKFIQMPVDKKANIKEELELVCSIQGKPTPIIQWLKNGDQIRPNDYMQIVGGHNLRILGLISSDAGMFQCIGTNPAGSVQAAARLQIVEPETKKKLYSNMQKQAGGKKKQTQAMQPQREDQDGPPSLLEKQNPRMLSKSVLDSLLSKDKKKPLPSDSGGDIGIGGSNTGGFNFGNGKLPIAAYNEYDDDDDGHGSIDDYDDNDNDDDDEHDDDDYNGPEVDSIHPIGPGVDPKKLLNSLTNSKHTDEIQHFSNLPNPTFARKHPYVTGTSVSGSSIGIGKNAGISDGVAGVAAPLPGAPRDLEAQIVKPRFVTLSWMEPLKHPDEVISYTVFYKMHTSERERKITTKSRDDQQVNIQSLLPGKIYQFRVVGNSNHGPGNSSQILEVSTQPEENIAGPPQDVKGYAISSEQIHVVWQEPLITNGIISKYRIYYAQDDNGAAEKYVDSTSLNVTINELRAYTEYIISVVPFNQNGMGDPSNEIKVKSYSSIPEAAPFNVTLEATSSTSITIRWEPPPEEYQNGQITGYKIRYRKTKKAMQVETTPGNARHYELKNLERMSAYQVKISAMTVNGSGPFTEWYFIETYENDLDESQVPGAPAWIKSRPSSESIGISWGPPTQQEIKIRGYMLGWGKGIPDEDTQELIEDLRYFEITRLEPNSEYVISLRARNVMGDGPPVYDYVRTREEPIVEAPTPLEVPVGLRAITMSATAIVVYWTDTTLSKSQHVTDNRHYVVRYNPTGTTRYKNHNTTDLNCMIGDLKPMTQYEFAVKIVKSRRESAWSMSVLNSTMPAAPVSPPRDLSVRADPDNQQSVILQWQPPKHSNGAITGYIAFYTTDTTKRDRDWHVEAFLGDKLIGLIRNLRPHTTYYFKVQTRNSKGYGPFSAMVSHTTGFEVASKENMVINGVQNPMVLYAIIGITIFTLLIAIAAVSLLCRRKPPVTPEHNKKSSYQKNNAGIIKPPDLWIHHDQMELKNLDKHTAPAGCSDGASSSGAMTLPRSVVHEFESEPQIPNVTNSLDKRTYVPGYITTPVNATVERPPYPRTQYNMSRPPHIPIDSAMSQQSLVQPAVMGGPLAQTPENPYGYDGIPNNYNGNAAISYGPQLIIDAPKRGQGHPLKSFSVPAPPATTPVISGQVKHVPSVTIRPQNSSPYKKPAMNNTLTNRLQTGPLVAHSTDEIQRLQPSTSTEELNQEMANLEGLMKDLSAITANEFECRSRHIN